MITEILVMGILGLVSAIGLELTSGVLGEEVDEDMEAIMNILPGVDCGACGNPSCEAHAKELLEEPETLGKCVVISEENKKEIAKILGTEYES